MLTTRARVPWWRSQPLLAACACTGVHRDTRSGCEACLGAAWGALASTLPRQSVHLHPRLPPHIRPPIPLPASSVAARHWLFPKGVSQREYQLACIQVGAGLRSCMGGRVVVAFWRWCMAAPFWPLPSPGPRISSCLHPHPCRATHRPTLGHPPATADRAADQHAGLPAHGPGQDADRGGGYAQLRALVPRGAAVAHMRVARADGGRGMGMGTSAASRPDRVVEAVSAHPHDAAHLDSACTS